jgi:hypothetical protein
VASLVLGSGVGSKDESWSGLYQRISLWDDTQVRSQMELIR